MMMRRLIRTESIAMAGRRRRRVRWVTAGFAALPAWFAAQAAASAHGLFSDGQPGDILVDSLMTFAVPLAIILGGAVAGIVLSRWLGRGSPVPQEAGAETADDLERGSEIDQSTGNA